MRYLIVGAGVAGIEAAREIRRHDRKGTITIIDGGNEDHQAGCIFRPALKEYLVGKVSEAALVVLPKGTLDRLGIEMIRGHAQALEAKKRVLTYQTETGEKVTLAYDRLLLATGAPPRYPSYLLDDDGEPGFTNAHPFITLADTEVLWRGLKARTGPILVIGGGILGVETAELLRQDGREVTLLSRSSNLLFPGIPEPLKARVMKLFGNKGVKVLLEAQVKRARSSTRELPNTKLTGQEFAGEQTKAQKLTEQESEGGEVAGQELAGLELADGSTIDCCMAIVCTGVSPDPTLATSGGLEFSRGIHVDRQMTTSDENIFAAGDCAYMPWFPRGTLRLWDPARRMGRVAGANMTLRTSDEGPEAVTFKTAEEGRGPTRFDPWPTFFHTLLFDMPVGLFGEYDAPAEGHERLVRETGSGYRELVLREGQLVGASFLGGRPPPPPFFHLMCSGHEPPGGYEQLLDDDFDHESLWYLQGTGKRQQE